MINEKVWEDRYAAVLPDGTKESWLAGVGRIAEGLTVNEPREQREQLGKRYFEQIYSGKFLPAGRIIRNAGFPGSNLCNCFVLPVEDSKESIGQLLKDIYIVSCCGGGSGTNYSKIRPKYSVIGNRRGYAPGIVSVLQMVNGEAEHSRSGGERRAALIGILDITHPDLEDFLAAKLEDGRLRNFNISVNVTPSFLKACHLNKEWRPEFRGQAYYPFEAIPTGSPAIHFRAPSQEEAEIRAAIAFGPNTHVRPLDEKILARDIWYRVVEAAVRCGEPGIVNMGLADQMNNGQYFESLDSTNPCLVPESRLIGFLKGYVTIGDVKVGDVIWQGRTWTTVVAKTDAGVQDVIETVTKHGTLISTKEHKIWDKYGKVQIEGAEYIIYSEEPDSEPPDMNPRWMISKVLSQRYVGKRQVYDITVDDPEHCFWCEGLKVSNCGEYPGAANTSCDLGSINLPLFVKEGKVDYKELKETIHVGVRILDSVLDITEHPTPAIKQETTKGRALGLGVMGFHHTLMLMGIRYGSDECISFIDELFSFVRDETYRASIQLAKEKGAFPAFDAHKYCQGTFYASLPRSIKNEIRKNGIRNVRLMAQAPNGTLHQLVHSSANTEPIPGRVSIRNDALGKRVIVDPIYAQLLQEGKDTSHIDASFELSPEDHIRVQEAIQSYIDNGVSKTIILPHEWEPSHENISSLADRLRSALAIIKGTTIYREGSRQGEILQRVSREEEEALALASTTTREVDHESCKSGVCEL